MKKLFFLLLFTTIAFGQGFEILSEYNDTLFDFIIISKIHNDSLLFCSGDDPTVSYSVSGVYKLLEDSEPELIWYFDPPERTHLNEICSLNDSVLYMLTYNSHDGYFRSYLETYFWSTDSSYPSRIDIDTLAVHRTSINYNITSQDSFLYITGLCDLVPHYICSISNPQNPVIITEIPAFGRYSVVRNQFTLDDSLLILLGDWPNYIVYNITEPSEPVYVADYEFSELNPEWEPCGITGYHVIDHYIVVHGVVGMTSGFYGVLDITNPIEPIPLNYYHTWDMVCYSRNNGNYILLANSGESYPYSDYQIFDFSNPIEPILLSTYPDTMLEDRDIGLFFHSQLQNGELYSNIATFYEDSSTYHTITKFNIRNILTRNITFDIKAGWNIISYPLFDKICIIDSLFSYDAYAYSSTFREYSEVETVSPGQGFWVFATRDTVIEYSECPNTYMVERLLYPGWNLIGPTLLDLPAVRILANPGIVSPIYEYNTELREYFETDTLRITRGYWVLASDTTKISLWREYHDEYYNH